MFCATAGAKPRWEKQLPDVARRLGWCTWDAFYTDVSAQGIIGGLESFKQAGLQPRWIIIDDGWQVRDGCWSALPVVQQAGCCCCSTAVAVGGDGVTCCRLWRCFQVVLSGEGLEAVSMHANFVERAS